MTPVTHATVALQPDAPHGPRRKPRRGVSHRWISATFLLVGVTGLVIGSVVGANATETTRGSGEFVGPATIDVTGGFLVPQDYGTFADDEGACSLSIGYSDFIEGAPITIQNSDGKTFIGHLEAPESIDDYCLFGFEIDDVQIADGDYLVTFSHRGTLDYSLAELRGGVALTMGD